MSANKLMLTHGRELEMSNRGEFVIPSSVSARIPLVEWMEFEQAFFAKAKELNLEVQVEVSPFSSRTTIKWRPANE